MPICEAKLTELKGELDNPIIMPGDLNNYLSVDRMSRQKKNH